MKGNYIIQGMHCNSCSKLIASSLEELDGVKSAKVSYEKGEAVVEFDENKVDSRKIISEIKKAGYKAEDLVEGKKKVFLGGIFRK